MLGFRCFRRTSLLANLGAHVAFLVLDSTFAARPSEFTLPPKILFFTMFTLYQNTLFLLLSFIAEFRPNLRETRDRWFYGVALPCSGLVTSHFWVFTALDRCSVLPCWAQTHLALGSATNHFLHTYPLAMILGFLALYRPRLPANLPAVTTFTAVAGIYFSIFYMYIIQTGIFPYPFMEEMTFMQTLALFIFSYLYAVGLIVFGKLLSTLLRL